MKFCGERDELSAPPRLISLLWVLFLVLVTTTSPVLAQTTIFEGGNLDDLRALSPTLVFDRLIIRGDLVLPAEVDVTINANEFLLESQAHIYGNSTSHDEPPNLELLTTGSAEIAGEINLIGKYGVRTTTNHSGVCDGMRGGNLSVISNELKVSGNIDTSGGRGSYDVFGYPIPSISCPGGSGGNIQLKAPGMDLSGATLVARAGENGDGSRAASGNAELEATTFTMLGESITVGDHLSFKAGTTSIFAPFNYRSIFELVGGVADTTPPDLHIISPTPGFEPPSGNIDVVVQISDAGTGVHSVTLSGLGSEQTYSGSLIVNGQLHVSYPATRGGSLTATARDNKGNLSSDYVAGNYPEPDLAITILKAEFHYYLDGEQPQVEIKIENIGQGISDPYRVTFYASFDTDISSVDHSFGYADLDSLGVGENHHYNFRLLPIPDSMPQGYYYLGAVLTVDDANHSNNSAYDTEDIYISTSTKSADLTITNLDAVDGTYAAGDVVHVDTRIENYGNTISDAYRITFYASTDELVTSSDLNFGYLDFDPLDVGEIHHYDISLIPIPGSMPDGEYYIGAILTPNDANSSNNTSYDTTPITVDNTSSFQLNAGLNDAWYEPATTGQGFFINVFPDIGYVSLSWFTYDTVRPDQSVTANLGDPGHRWLMALGTYSGNQAVMDISITSGGIFDAPTEVSEANEGTIILTFTDCENGRVEYDIPSINKQGIVPIQRVVGDNIAFCESLAEQNANQKLGIRQKSKRSGDTVSGEIPVTEAQSLNKMNAGLNDAWFKPATTGQGFFINVFPDIEYVSLSWFTYDTVRPDQSVTANLGDPGHRWLMALGAYSGNQAVMDISITSGGIFDTPTVATEVIVGTITLTFPDCESGTVEYNIPSINQHGTVPLQRVVGDNISLCEALNTD